MVIIENIKKRSTELTRKQYMVAMYMIDHPDEMAYITLKELSQNIGVTEITILNTCASLGYEGFTQIKYEFRKDIIQKQKTDVLDDSSVYTEKFPNMNMITGKRFCQRLEMKRSKLLRITGKILI